MAEWYVYRGSLYRDNEAPRAWLARKEPEEIMEPALPIIDLQHHFDFGTAVEVYRLAPLPKRH